MPGLRQLLDPAMRAVDGHGAAKKMPPAQRLALPVAGAVAVITFIILQVLNRHAVGNGADFRAVLRGASDLAGGRDLYAPALQLLSSGHLRDILSMQVTPYVYPPLLAVAMRPLTAISPSVALGVWDAINVVVLAILFVLVVRLSAARTLRQLIAIGVLYGFYPLNMGLGTGQIDIAISLLALLSFLLYRSGHTRRAGIVLAIVALIKPTIGILVLFYCCRRAWPVVMAFISTVLVGLVASLVVAGSRALWEYRQVVAGWANTFGVLPLNQSLHGLVVRLLAPGLDRPPTGLSGAIALALEGVFLLLAGSLIWRLLRGGEPEPLRLGALQFYAAFSVLLLGIPFTENLHLTWLLPGVGLLLAMTVEQTGRTPWKAVAIGAYLVLALPFTENVAWRAGADIVGRLSSGGECYGLIALAATMAYVGFSRRAARPERQRRGPALAHSPHPQRYTLPAGWREDRGGDAAHGRASYSRVPTVR